MTHLSRISRFTLKTGKAGSRLSPEPESPVEIIGSLFSVFGCDLQTVQIEGVPNDLVQFIQDMQDFKQ